MMRTFRTALLIICLSLGLGVALSGCSGGSSSNLATPESKDDGTSSVTVTPIPPGGELSYASVAGTYASGDWVIRLSANGTWEEDLKDKKNAYGGEYTIEGDKVLLKDRGGSSETATISGDELRLPSITLKKQTS